MGIRTLRRRSATAATRRPWAEVRLPWVHTRVRRAHAGLRRAQVHLSRARTRLPWALTHPLPALRGHVPPYAPGVATRRVPGGARLRRPSFSGARNCPPPRRRPWEREPGARP